MPARLLSAPDQRTLRRLDIVLALWVAIWLGLGAWAGYDLYRIGALSDSVASSGVALDHAGQAIQSLGKIPIIGQAPKGLGQKVSSIGSQVTTGARDTGDRTRQLGVLLGVVIAVIPITPVFGVYLPLRIRRAREVVAVRRALAHDAGDPAVLEFLAHRAVAALSLPELLAVTRTPWHDLAAGRYYPLANAELRRLGLTPYPLPPAQ